MREDSEKRTRRVSVTSKKARKAGDAENLGVPSHWGETQRRRGPRRVREGQTWGDML